MLTQQDMRLIDNKIDAMKDELKNDIYQFKDDILTEIIKLRDDFAVLTGYRDKIEDHDTRIDRLEKDVYASK